MWPRTPLSAVVIRQHVRLRAAHAAAPGRLLAATRALVDWRTARGRGNVPADLAWVAAGLVALVVIVAVAAPPPASNTWLVALVATGVLTSALVRQGLRIGVTRTRVGTYRAVLAAMVDGVVVRDARGRLLDVNEAALAHLGLARATIERPTADACLAVARESEGDAGWRVVREDGLPATADETSAVLGFRPHRRFSHAVLGLVVPGRDVVWLLVNGTVVPDGADAAARVTTLTDITAHVRRHRAGKRFDLSTPIEAGDLVPLCMHCKDVRDTDGYWQHIEQYFADRTDVLFTHGVCPDCLTRHYPAFSR